jgi:hypothetical protein
VVLSESVEVGGGTARDVSASVVDLYDNGVPTSRCLHRLAGTAR